MIFDAKAYSQECIEWGGQSIFYRAFRHICYVERPEDEIQRLSIYVPEAYYIGEEINGYSLKTAPVFMPNTVGGYRSGPEEEPKINKRGEANSILRGLMHGYVAVSAGVRGRDSMNRDGKYTGTAPAAVCDMKAVVRYLRSNADLVPGNTERIITNGTSAGGALSALMGATGDHPDYEPYLREMGAAQASDRVYAASCYCPITNLDHADMAYEWEFAGLDEYHGWMGSGKLTERQKRLSAQLAEQFPDYLNSLQLKAEDGRLLLLDQDKKGSFCALLEQLVAASAQKELEKGRDLSGCKWLKIENSRVTAVDLGACIRYRTRMKAAPAFDSTAMNTPENELFGTKRIRSRHFTRFGFEHSEVTGEMAQALQIKMMNPMYYIGDEQAIKAEHYRIRHGSVDTDTSLAIPALLHTKLRNEGIDSDLAFPWEIPHAGDYDLDDLFSWIDRIV